MRTMIVSEMLKTRRSFAKKLALAAPLFFALYGAVIRIYLPDQTKMPWDLLLGMVFNWWPVLFVPLGVALLCALAEYRERKAGNYRGIYSNNISLIKLWLGKIAAIGILLLMSTVVLIVVVSAVGWWTSSGDVPIAKIVAASLLVWFAAFSLVPFHLFAAARFGVFGGLLSGIPAMLIGVLSADQPYWLFNPWSWPTRMMSPMVGVHPNGVMLHEGDLLLDSSVIPEGIAASFLFLVVTSLLTACWFAKREVR